MADPSPPRPTWIWPYAVPQRIGQSVLRRAQAVADHLGAWPRWLLAGILLGSLPSLLLGLIGWTAVAILKAILSAVPLTAAAARDWPGRGFLLFGDFIATHSAITLVLTMRAPTPVASWFPDGDAYWHSSREWIVTGRNPEYDPAHWVPVHLAYAVGTPLAAYPSAGALPLFRGLHQVDLMNVYVGHLVGESKSPVLALVVGWHPWSMLRGLGLMLLTFEAVSVSLQRLSGTQLSSNTCRWRRMRWAIFFLVLDGMVKYFCLDAARALLADNLIDA